MGRVDEARRRAAEAAATGDVAAADAAASTLPSEPAAMADDADVDVLAREPYPIELGERRRARTVPMTMTPAPGAPRDQAKSGLGGTTYAKSSVQADAGAAGASPAEAAPSDALPSRTLFERLAARLSKKVVVDQAMMPASREQYRRLAAALHQNQSASGLKVVMISSAVASEGKTLTAANLALTFSESYHRSVLLIDGDLRRPSIHTVFGITDELGLSDGLSAPDERPLTLHQVTQRLTVLPGGKPISDPMAGLTSDRMRRLIEEARDAFDWVIIDTPPVGILTDANLLASMVDGAVLVVKAEATPYPLVQRAIDVLGRNRILGIVLNRATAPTQGSYNSYYHYYNTGQRQLPPSEKK
jgi:protein-tyrosine kinase